MRGGRPWQPVGLWEWACVSVVPELHPCPLVFSGPGSLLGWLCLRVSGWMGSLFLCVPLGLCLCVWAAGCFSLSS